jgi:hypothetical protein
MFEWTVDILMGTNCVSFPADYLFVSMKQTILKETESIYMIKNVQFVYFDILEFIQVHWLFF